MLTTTIKPPAHPLVIPSTQPTPLQSFLTLHNYSYELFSTEPPVCNSPNDLIPRNARLTCPVLVALALIAALYYVYKSSLHSLYYFHKRSHRKSLASRQLFVVHSIRTVCLLVCCEWPILYSKVQFSCPHLSTRATTTTSQGRAEWTKTANRTAQFIVHGL